MRTNCNKKEAFVITATVLASLVSALILSEILLRIIQPTIGDAYRPQAITMSHFRASSYLPFELRPNNHSRFRMLEFDTTVSTNSRGLRDDEIDFSRPRILCLGDSFTFGFGVENNESFCAILERLFDRQYEFVNAGFADGCSPDSYALWLAKHGPTIDPQLIIVGLYQNDYADVNLNTWFYADQEQPRETHILPEKVIRTGEIITADGVWMRDTMAAKLPSFARNLLRQSYLVAFIRDRLVHDAEMAQKASINSNGQRDYARSDEKFNASLEMLWSVARPRPMVLYIIPEKGQIGSSHMDRLVYQFGAKHQIPVLSNATDFQEPDFYHVDWHWNRQGHVKAAQYLYRSLAKLGLNNATAK